MCIRYCMYSEVSNKNIGIHIVMYIAQWIILATPFMIAYSDRLSWMWNWVSNCFTVHFLNGYYAVNRHTMASIYICPHSHTCLNMCCPQLRLEINGHIITNLFSFLLYLDYLCINVVLSSENVFVIIYLNWKNFNLKHKWNVPQSQHE